MATKGITSKRALIDQANSSLVIVVALSAFLTIFSLVACKTLFSQFAYQNRVLKEKHATVTRLRSNITAANQLGTSYKAFTTTTSNIIGGDSKGNGTRDGNNAKIVLDALPSTYDFPALTTSIEKMITDVGNIKITSITGVDDEVAQRANAETANPETIPMPFTVVVDGNYQGVQQLISKFEHSIRPFQIQSMTVGGTQSSVTMTIVGETYYQPQKGVNITTKVVK